MTIVPEELLDDEAIRAAFRAQAEALIEGLAKEYDVCITVDLDEIAPADRFALLMELIHWGATLDGERCIERWRRDSS